MRGLAYVESAVENIDTQHLHGSGSKLTPEGLKRVLSSSNGEQLASLLGVAGGKEVDAIMRMFDADNNGELDAEESQVLIEMIKKRAAFGAPKAAVDEAAPLDWPMQGPPPTPAETRAMVSEHYARHNARPLYAPGEITLEDRVAKLAEQSSILAHMVAEHNTSTIKAIDELDSMLAFVSGHVANELSFVPKMASNGDGAGPAFSARERMQLSRAADPTLPLFTKRQT